MGIFGGEKYSKEAYKGAAAQATHEEDLFNSRNEVLAQYPENIQTLYSALLRSRNEARSRVEKLHGKGQAEAIALNEEYDRLVAQVQEAVKALGDFEKEKLGMSEGE